MATGANIQGGRGATVSNITPSVNIQTGDAETWDAARRTFDRLYDAAKPNLIRRAQALGTQEGREIAEGAREMGSAVPHGAPPDLAGGVETYAQQQAQRGLEQISSMRVARDDQEFAQSLGVRIAELDERMIALASRGERDSAAYLEAQGERAELQTQRAQNPLILYSDDQRGLDDDKLDEAVLGADVTRLAMGVYSESGRGLAGQAAALRYLRENVLEGEAFRDLPPERTQRIYRDATSQLRDFTAADLADQRAADEDERQRRAAQREIVGDVRLRILLGEATEAEILSIEGIDDTARAGLIQSARSYTRQQQTMARQELALDRAAEAQTYNELRDQAQAGLLTNSDISDALAAGQITAGRAQTLRTLNDRAIRPLVDELMAPTRERARGRRNTAEQLMIAEQGATEAIRAGRVTADMTLDQRIAAGNAIRDSVFGGRTAGAPASGAARTNAAADRIAEVNARIRAAEQAGRPFSLAEQNRMRNEARNAD